MALILSNSNHENNDVVFYDERGILHILFFLYIKKKDFFIIYCFPSQSPVNYKKIIPLLWKTTKDVI